MDAWRRPLAVVALLFGAPAVAAVAELPPILDEVAFASSGYAAWRVHASGGERVGLEVAGARDSAVMKTLALWVLRWDQPELLHASSLTTHGGETRLHAEAAPVGPLVTFTNGARSGGESFWQRVMDVASDGDYLLVATVAADGGVHGSATLFGDQGVEVLGRSMGEGFLRRLSDFRGDTNIDVRSAASLREVDNAVRREVVSQLLFGMFYGDSNSGDLRMHYEGPSGLRSGETVFLLNGEPQGSYGFHVDHVTDYSPPCSSDGIVYLCPPPTIFLFGADVMPP